MYRSARSTTTSLEAYDAYLRGSHHFERFTREEHQEARRWLVRAVELDPGFPAARALLANSYVLEYALGWNRDPEILKKGEVLVRQVLEDAPTNPSGHLVMANVENARGDWKAALAEADRAMELNPNFDVPYIVRALSLLQGRSPLAALRSLQHGIRLNPRGNTFNAVIGMVDFRLGQRREAVELWEASRRENELLPPRFALAIYFVEEGRMEDAREVVAEILEINPRLTAAEAVQVMSAARIENAEDALRKAGLP